MASRDLTSIFIERRNTSNLRLRTGGPKTSKTGGMKPFHISSGDGGDHDLLIEVREVRLCYKKSGSRSRLFLLGLIVSGCV